MNLAPECINVERTLKNETISTSSPHEIIVHSFPFYVVVDKQLNCVEFGPELKELLMTRSHFNDMFVIVSPAHRQGTTHDEFSWSTLLTHNNESVRIKLKSSFFGSNETYLNGKLLAISKGYSTSSQTHTDNYGIFLLDIEDYSTLPATVSKRRNSQLIHSANSPSDATILDGKRAI